MKTRKNKSKNILFLGSFVKKNNTGGSVGVDYILNNLSFENIHWLNTRPSFKTVISKESLNIYDTNNYDPFFYRFVNYIIWKVDFNILRRLIFSQKIPFLLSHICFLFHKNVWSQIQLLSLNTYIKKNDINYFIISLDNDFIIFSHAFINHPKRNNIISIVSDDPGASLKLYGVPNKIIDNVEKLFKKVLIKSKSIAVISEGMQIYYKKLANVNSIITYPVNTTKLFNKEEIIAPSIFKIKIIHIGHLRISEIANLNIFITALNDSGIDYEFYFLGRDAERYELVNSNDKIKILGWVSQTELEQHIASSNFAYVPYSFETEHKVFVSTSFPNKVTSFLKLGIPIIHHGPQFSSVATFIKRYDVGFVINSLEKNIIKKDIHTILTSLDMEKMRIRCLEIATIELNSLTIAGHYEKMIDDLTH